MTPGQVYETVIEGCGDDKVKYLIVETIARAVQFTNIEKTEARKAEVAITSKGAIIGRKVTYGADESRVVTHKKFDSVQSAGTWFSKDKPEEEAILSQLKPYVEGEKKLNTYDL
jgi:hypothetical protein